MRYEAEARRYWYEHGMIVTEYSVLIPDRTISGDYRREFVVTKIPAMDLSEDMAIELVKSA